MSSPAPITAIVTAFNRIEQTIETISRIQACNPIPHEILVHVDANQEQCANAIRRAFPNLRVLVSTYGVGPGGGRNRLIAEARNDLIASFDDDSYPVDLNYFARVRTLVETFPDASIFAASIFHRGEPPTNDVQEVSPTASFGAGGAIFRRQDFLDVGGFVPLVVAYGMEEEDLALRLLNQRRELLATPWLRIFHDTDLSHHQSARVTSGTIANIALLASLRYPPSYWPYGALQVANRVMWCLRVGRYAGVLSGLAAIPGHLTRHRQLRAPVSLDTMRLRREVRVAHTKPFAIDVSERSAAT